MNQIIRFEITLTFVGPIHELSDDKIMETNPHFGAKFMNGEYMCMLLHMS